MHTLFSQNYPIFIVGRCVFNSCSNSWLRRIGLPRNADDNNKWQFFESPCAKEKRGKQIHEKTSIDIVGWDIWWQYWEWQLLVLSTNLFRARRIQLSRLYQSQSPLCHKFLAFEVERWDFPWTARLNPQTATSWVEWRHLLDINPNPESVEFKDMCQHRKVYSNTRKQHGNWPQNF